MNILVRIHTSSSSSSSRSAFSNSNSTSRLLQGPERTNKRCRTEYPHTNAGNTHNTQRRIPTRSFLRSSLPNIKRYPSNLDIRSSRSCRQVFYDRVGWEDVKSIRNEIELHSGWVEDKAEVRRCRLEAMENAAGRNEGRRE